MVKILTEENFKQTITEQLPVLVDFWAEWCGPCAMMSPIVEQLAQENDELVVAKLNVDEAPAIAAEYGISAIPTIILFKNGKPAATAVGVRSKDELLKMIRGN